MWQYGSVEITLLVCNSGIHLLAIGSCILIFTSALAIYLLGNVLLREFRRCLKSRPKIRGSITSKETQKSSESKSEKKNWERQFDGFLMGVSVIIVPTLVLTLICPDWWFTNMLTSLLDKQNFQMGIMVAFLTFFLFGGVDLLNETWGYPNEYKSEINGMLLVGLAVLSVYTVIFAALFLLFVTAGSGIAAKRSDSRLKQFYFYLYFIAGLLLGIIVLISIFL